MTTLLELAARCEAATGVDRGLDIAIALSQPDRFFNDGPKYEGQPDRIGEIVCGDRCVPSNCAPDWLVPRYTTSLDAAMALTPAPGKWAITSSGHDGGWQAWVWIVDDLQPNWTAALTPALALCAAALRARHALNEGSQA